MHRGTPETHHESPSREDEKAGSLDRFVMKFETFFETINQAPGGMNPGPICFQPHKRLSRHPVLGQFLYACSTGSRSNDLFAEAAANDCISPLIYFFRIFVRFLSRIGSKDFVFCLSRSANSSKECPGCGFLLMPQPGGASPSACPAKRGVASKRA